MKLAMQHLLTIINDSSFSDGFNNERVSNDDIDRVLHAAMVPPAIARMLPWKFFVVREEMKINSIADKLMLTGTSGNADAYIVICAFPEEIEMTNEASVISDCIIAGKNILFAAEATGLAADCVDIYPDWLLMDFVRKEFDIHENVIPVCIVSLATLKSETETQSKYNAAALQFEKWL